MADDDPSGRDLDVATLSDADKRAVLRAVADDIRVNEAAEAEQVAALVHRISDIYDPGEETTPRDVYVNMRNILRVKEQGGRNPDPEGM